MAVVTSNFLFVLRLMFIFIFIFIFNFCPLPLFLPLPLPLSWEGSSSFFFSFPNARARRAFSSLFADLSFSLSSWIFSDPSTSSSVRLLMTWNYSIELVMESNFPAIDQRTFAATLLSAIFSPSPLISTTICESLPK